MKQTETGLCSFWQDLKSEVLDVVIEKFIDTFDLSAYLCILIFDKEARSLILL